MSKSAPSLYRAVTATGNKAMMKVSPIKRHNFKSVETVSSLIGRGCGNSYFLSASLNIIIFGKEIEAVGRHRKNRLKKTALFFLTP